MCTIIGDRKIPCLSNLICRLHISVNACKRSPITSGRHVHVFALRSACYATWRVIICPTPFSHFIYSVVRTGLVVQRVWSGHVQVQVGLFSVHASHATMHPAGDDNHHDTSQFVSHLICSVVRAGWSESDLRFSPVVVELGLLSYTPARPRAILLAMQIIMLLDNKCSDSIPCVIRSGWCVLGRYR